MAERKTDRDYDMERQQLDYLRERKPRFVQMIMNLNEYKNMGMSPEEYQQALNSMQTNFDMPDSFLQEVLEAGNKAYQESRQPRAEGSLMTPREGYLVGGQKEIDVNNDGKISGEDFKILNERQNKAEGSLMMPEEGMPVDTYPNIPPEEMAAVKASQLPDNEMEEDYIKFVMDQSLTDEEQNYLADAIDQDPKLSSIMDKVIVTASEFSGAGEVDGPGTGVSDSIPARLSDGEFVITKKATDQIGAENLQRMMDDAERAYDGGYQMKAMGGMMDEEDPEAFDMSKTNEEIDKLMMRANRMPSLQ